MSGDKNKTDLEDFDPTIDPFTGEPILSREEMDALSDELQTGKQHKQTLEQQERELRAEGWKTLAEAQEITGLDSDTALWKRTKVLRDKDSPLVWKGHGNHSILVHSEQVEEWLAAIQHEDTLKEDDNWLRLEDAAQTAGLSYMAAYKRANKGDASMIWKHPHVPTMYVHRESVDQWKSVANKEAGLINDEYLYAGQIAERTGLPKKAMIESRIAALGKSGSSLVWLNPYSRKVLVAPEAVEEWKKLSEKMSATKSQAEKTRGAGYVTITEAAETIGMARETLEARVLKMDADKIYSLADGEFRGDELVVKLDMPTTKAAPMKYIHPALLQDWKQSEEKRRELIGKGWIGITEAEKIVGPLFTRARLLRLDPNGRYNDRAYEAKEDEAAYGGQDLVYVDSSSSLLSPLLVNNLRADAEESSQLKEQGYVSTGIVAEQLGISINSVMTRVHRHSYADMNADDGLPLIRRNPFTKDDVLFHPALLAQWLDNKKINDNCDQLLEEGYRPSNQVVRDTDLTAIIISKLAARVAADAEYHFASASGPERIIKGSDLIRTISGPHVTTQVLIHPHLAESIAKTEDVFRGLKERGFKTIQEAAAETNIKESTLLYRVRSIAPIGDRAFIPHPNLDAAAELPVWRHPYTDKKTIINPELVKSWKVAEEKCAGSPQEGSYFDAAKPLVNETSSITHSGTIAHPVSRKR